jgi:predicted transcriptional regulator
VSVVVVVVWSNRLGMQRLSDEQGKIDIDEVRAALQVLDG